MLVLIHLFCDPTEILSLIGGERLQVTQELGPFVDIIARRGEKKWYQNLQVVRWERANWHTGKVSHVFRFRWNFHVWLWMLTSLCFFSEELGKLEYDIRWKIPSWESFVPSFPRSETSASTILWSPAQCDSGWQTFSSRPIWVLQPISLPELSADREGTS